MRIHPELPIYQLTGPGDSVILYTPGTFATASRAQAALIQQAWNGDKKAQKEGALREQSAWLLKYAQKAVDARNKWLTEEYRPECLTVYLSNQCNLRCVYCFSAPTRSAASAGLCLHPKTFTAAAELVGRNCADKGQVFQLCCHGGGEPMLHWELLLQLVQISKSVAERNNVAWNGYIATNGVIPLKRATEMAAIFDRVGLSCDGPPDIQDRQRPSFDDTSTSFWVRQTAVAVKKAGVRLDLRATITPKTISRQTEILNYLITELGADSITFEPVYEGNAGNSNDRHHRLDPEEWAEHFMRARREALQRNVELTFSGFRPGEHHGPYCNTLRQSLHLTSNGKATNCFLVVDGDDPAHSAQIIGEFDRCSGRFVLDQTRIISLRDRAACIGLKCQACFAAYHCARSCPDNCPPLDSLRPSEKTTEAPFRCRLNRAIGHALINEAALELLREEAGEYASVLHKQSATDTIRTTLSDLPRLIRQEVQQAWEASHPYYHLENRSLPTPIWAKKGFQYGGNITWEKLCHIVNTRSARPYSIYIHIPFCEKHCGFCDCYTLSTRPGHHLHHDYAQRLRRDLQQWSEQTSLPAWPVTTIHFGGGTPNYLLPSLFTSIVKTIRAKFHIQLSTEWALESTAQQLTRPHLEFLWNLGFRRLHIGVQTLEEPLRQEIGRREASETVLKRITHCIERGFVTTVDLLYGLPGQTIMGFFSGIDRLDSLGIHGISLYRFNQSHRNRRFMRRYSYQPDILKDFSIFLAADSKLIQAGYDKNHFCHYAKYQDRNLYYTHAKRGEDLLAIGASADGIFADLHYRCPQLSKRFLEIERDYPLFQGSIRESAENSIRSTIGKHLMTGSIHENLLCANDNLGEIVKRWRNCRFIREKKNNAHMFSLTGNGSWHLSTMLEELEEHSPKRV